MIQGTAVGNLGIDVTEKKAGNKTMCRLRVACRSGYDKATGDDATTWINATLWEPSPTLVRALVKGTRIAFAFTIREKHWTDGQGKNHIDLEFVVTPGTLELLGGGTPKEKPVPPATEIPSDEEIPF